MAVCQSNSISIVCYNIGGLKGKTFNNDFFNNILFDIFLLVETYIEQHNEDSYRKFFPGFNLCFVPAVRRSIFGRASGGCIFGVNRNLKQFDLSFHKLGEMHTISVNIGYRINIVPVYINCNNWMQDFSSIQDNFINFSISNCILIGDVNARIGVNQILDTPNIIDLPSINNNRHSKDKTFDQKGKLLTEFLSDNGIIILNGRTTCSKGTFGFFY